ncbi:hypothetical protein F66182_7917 [Fusarium sp. NRRL 66182]|nr:hypothetical protein F66182_7917 [Fusarium sp. NRRL 66182]
MDADTKQELELLDGAQSQDAGDVYGNHVFDKLSSDGKVKEDEVTDQESAENETHNEHGSDDDVSDNTSSATSTSTGSSSSLIQAETYPYSPGGLHQLGLEVVSADDKSDNASYDVVAIHGLHGRSRTAWGSPGQSPYQSWLDTEFPGLPGHSGRVMLYGYDPGDRTGKTWTSYGVFKEAEALLEALLIMRTPEIMAKRRPLWFISQDIGGLIVKAQQALTLATRRNRKYGDILNCTRSLVIIEVNDVFVQTRFLVQANLFNLCPTLEQRLINQTPPVYPYLQAETDSVVIPELEDLAKAGDERIVHLRCTPSNPPATERVSERARIFLIDHKKMSQPLLYFKFNAHNIRARNVTAMLQTFLARLILNCPKGSEHLVQSVIERLRLTDRTTPHDLFVHFEHLRKEPEFESSIYVLACFEECDDSSLWFISRLRSYVERTESCLRLLITTTRGTSQDEAVAAELAQFPFNMVTSIEYDPPMPQLYDSNNEASLIVQERPYLARDGRDDAIKDLLIKNTSDRNLCKLLVDWLQMAENPFGSGATLFDEPLTLDMVFKRVLAEMPAIRTTWAKNLLCCVLSALRPLQLDEFCWIADDLWHQTGEKGQNNKLESEYDTWSHTATILRHFCGLLVVEYGEVRFRHPETRDWLLDNHQNIDEWAWYRQDSQTQRHQMVLETCLRYVSEKGESDHVMGSIERCPYAIEYWAHHYQAATSGMTERVVSIFKQQSILQRWLDACRNLQTPLMKPEPDTSTFLAVAAHFDLNDITRALVADSPDDVEAQVQALVEAARVGNIAPINTILES